MVHDLDLHLIHRLISGLITNRELARTELKPTISLAAKVYLYSSPALSQPHVNLVQRIRRPLNPFIRHEAEKLDFANDLPVLSGPND